MTYESVLWVSVWETRKQKLQLSQNNILRRICKTETFVQNNVIHAYIKILPLPQVIKWFAQKFLRDRILIENDVFHFNRPYNIYNAVE